MAVRGRLDWGENRCEAAMNQILPILLLAAVPALADDAELLQKYRGSADPCWYAAADVQDLGACDGLLSEACMAGEPGGMSNLGMSQCVYAEAAFWDEKLNEEWRVVIALMREADRESAAYEPAYAVREEKLRAAQRAWITFRDAQCAFDYAIPGGGSIRQLYAPACLSDMTFERLGDLRAIRAEFEF